MNMTTKKLSIIGITASVYVVMTLAFPMLSYGEIQFRFSEILNLLAFLNPVFAPGIILGCFISNLFSTINPLVDSIVGTGATALAVLFITRFSKNLFIACIWPIFFCFIIGVEIMILSGIPMTVTNFILISSSVMAGEAGVMIIGYIIFKNILKNKKLMEMIINI